MSEQELKRKNLKLLKEKISLKNDIIEYKKCKSKTHILVGLTILIGLLPIPSLLKILEVIGTKSFIISISIVGLISIYGTVKTYNHFQKKLKELKKKNPTIETFTDANLETLEKEIQALNNLTIKKINTKEPPKQHLYQNIPPMCEQHEHVKSIGSLKRRR